MMQISNVINDVYYSDKYISLYLKDGEEQFSFKYESNGNYLVNKSIKKKISKIGSLTINDGYSDLETAYGYGGLYTNSTDADFIKEALAKYQDRCDSEKIIAEFVRFHPFNNFPQQQNSFFDFNLYDRDVVVVNLEQDILKSYNAKVRNAVKRATEKVSFKKSADIDTFIKIYNATMEKNNATEFYFFDKCFFENLLALSDVELYEVIYENEIIAMGFFMFSDQFAHYHLSANTDLSYRLNSNYALLNHLFHIAQQKEKKYFVLGGGTSSSVDDPLFKFKKKFSKDLKPFNISGKIYNKEIYNKYNLLWQNQTESANSLFLKYRVEI